MFGRKNREVKDRPEVPRVELPKEPLPDHEIEIRAKWSDSRADWHYVLYKLYRGQPGWFAGPNPAPDAWYWGEEVDKFDKEWAEREARHYGIKIQYEDRTAELKP